MAFTMSLICHECNVTLQDDVLDEYNAIFVVSLVTRDGLGKLLISNRGLTICRRDFGGLYSGLITDPDQIKAQYFLAVDDRQGYDDVVADPAYFQPAGYRFIGQRHAYKVIPETTRALKSGIETTTWIEFKALQKRSA